MAFLHLEDQTFDKINEKFLKNLDEAATLYDNTKDGEAVKIIHDSLRIQWTNMIETIQKAQEKKEPIDQATLDAWKEKLANIDTVLNGEMLNRNAISRTQVVNQKMSFAVQTMSLRIDEYIASNGDICKVETLKKEAMDRFEAEEQEAKRQEELKKQEEEEAKRQAELKKQENKELVEKYRKREEVKGKIADARKKLMLDVKDMADSFKEFEHKLAVTNEKFFTRQSDQFEAFRNCLKVLNSQLKIAGGKITENNVDKIGKTIVALRCAQYKYDAHCKKHPKSDQTRKDRVNTVFDTMKKVVELERKSGVIVEAEKKIIGGKGELDMNTAYRETVQHGSSMKNLQVFDNLFRYA